MAEICCQELDRHLADFVDGELSPELTAAMKSHLKNCNFCSELVSSYVKTIFILKKVNEVEPPPDVVVRLRHYLNSKLNM